MDVEDNLRVKMEDTTHQGLYHTLKEFSQKYAEKIPGCDKRIVNKVFYRNYGILLKKVETNFIAIPPDWTDEDMLNALYLQICQYNDGEATKQLWKKLEIIYKLQNSDIYQNSISPIIKMIYSISINTTVAEKRKRYSRFKAERNWFDTDFILKSSNDLKKYLPKQKNFFTFSKIHSSQSEGNLAIFRSHILPSSLRFDNIHIEPNKIKQEGPSYDLDEGFVTPSEDHKEKSPCIEKKIITSAIEKKPFDWDFKVVSTSPSEKKTWERFDLLGKKPEHHFVPKHINIHYWLSKAPHSITNISGEKLLDDIMSLLIGIQSTTFILNGGSFSLKAGVYTNDFTAEEVVEMTKQYIEAAEAFLALTNLSESNSNGDTIAGAFKHALKQYLYNYQGMIFNIMQERSSKATYICHLKSLIEQVIYLKKLLIQSEELKGVALLEQLFNYMKTSYNQNFYMLASLFLYPCVYYFRLIDDWIFHGIWHRDLPITPCDIRLVQDRQSWEEAYAPIPSVAPWFVPVKDLAFCGKALSLLSLSTKSGMFLNMLKSCDRPNVKLCLQLKDLKELEAQCYDYYKKAKHAFIPEKHDKVNFVLCAQNSAKMRTEAFEVSKKEKNEIELERKRKELHLREEDLIRSAKVKEMKKHEEELENIRVAEEIEEKLFKKNRQDFENAKNNYRMIKQELDKEEKKELRAEWMFKRQLLNRKRQEYFNDKLCTDENLDLKIKDSSINLIEKKTPEVQNQDNNKVSHICSVNSEETQEFIELKKLKRDINKDECNENIEAKYSELERNRLKVLGSNLCTEENLDLKIKDSSIKLETKKISEVHNQDNNTVSRISIFNGNEETQKCLEQKKIKSDINMDECNENVECTEAEYSELERNRFKVLSSNLGMDVKLTDCFSENQSCNNEAMEYEGSEIIEIIENNDVNKYSDLVRNREKSLHSDFNRENKKAIYVGQDEAEQNKTKILGTHFTLGTNFTAYEKVNPSNVKSISENSEKSDDFRENTVNQHNKSQLSADNYLNTSKCSRDFEFTCQENICRDNISSNDVAAVTNEDVAAIIDKDQIDLSNSDKIYDQPQSVTEHIGVNGVNWFRDCNKYNERLMNLFNVNSKTILPKQSLDYYSLLKGVPGSLKLVLDTQIRLVNQALLQMFLNELKLLTEAGKLKKYFFLDGEFGKKLTSSLCIAMEKEKPSTLLTFGILRDVLAAVSQGDDKVSFVVKETPAAFEHTNPQALSCLGLSYKFNWPLNLIFTEMAVSKYNTVFEYMLSLQRVTWHLERVWLALKFKSSLIKGHEYTQIQLYRHVMSQFVCSIRWYIGTSVFENCWQKFNSDVMEVTNLQELYKKHAAYVKEILFRCFLNEKSIRLMKTFQNILKYILIFCQVIRFGEWSISKEGTYHHSNFTKLQNTFSGFLKLARYIVRQIEKLVKVNYQEGLANLYNFLTLNSFYLT